jgi:colanic acid/amylovoran biosynthesis protein
MTRVLMVGSSLSNNFGGPSLMISICKCLRKVMPDAQLRIVTDSEKSPEQARRYEKDYDVARVKGFRARYRFLGLIQSFLCAKARKIGVHFPSFLMSNPWLDELRNSDVVMDTRGISQTDYFSHWRTHVEENIPLMTAVYLGKPAIKYTQDMGPFLNRSNRVIARHCFPRYDLIIARGIIVRELLKEIGVSRNVKVLPDTAFILDPAPQVDAAKVLEREGVTGRPLIGIAASRQVDRRILKDGEKTLQNAYTLALAHIADHVIRKFQATVIFIPNERAQDTDGYDDVYVAQKAYDRMASKANAHVLTGSYDAEVTKGLIANCDVMIASRYHSVVAAFSSRVPTMVIGWGFKYDQLTEMVGQRRYLFNYEGIDLAKMEAAVTHLWENREAVRQDLETVVPRIQEMVYSGGGFVREVIEKRRLTRG